MVMVFKSEEDYLAKTFQEIYIKNVFFYCFCEDHNAVIASLTFLQ